MDDLAFGRLIRLARIRKGWRQQDLALRAGVSRSQVSRLELGHLGELDVGDVRRVAGALDIRVELVGRSRAIDLDRVVNARHSALAEFISDWIQGFPGWTVRSEATYSEYGERGSIDLLCWHAASRSLLVVEIKTELLEFGALLAKMDEKERLARRVARRLDWDPAVISTSLLVAESPTNRRRAAAHASLLRSALPDDARALVRWLKNPVGAVHAIRFVANSRPGHARNEFGSPTRIRRRSGVSESAVPRSARAGKPVGDAA